MNVLVLAYPGLAAFASDEPGVVQYGDGVTVRKNPDGSVEVSDGGGDGSDYASAPPAPVQHAHSSRHTSYRPKTGTTRYSDGLAVRRNSDGTVDVGPSPSRSNRIACSQSRHTRPGRTACRYADGVTVRHNSDGSVEVFDAPSYGHYKH